MKNYPAMTVYSASAGSGKTFTLAVRYIELLINDPTAYQKTLAVTFTNKATEEMKMRILSELYGLWQGLSDSDDYLERVANDLGVSEPVIRQKAGEALEMMLHDYSRFAVETIDSFFQRVLRNLARELDLNANLRVELNGEDIESIAVDNLIAKLSDNKKVMNWIMDYIGQSLEDDKGWNIIKSIKDFGKRIFSDDYKRNAKELDVVLQDEKLFNSFKDELRKMVHDADELMTGYAKEFNRILAENNVTINDLSSKEKGAASYFIKLGNKKYTDAAEFMGANPKKGAAGPDGWVLKSCKPTSPLYILAAEKLVPLINKAEEDRQRIMVPAGSARVILNNLNELRLLHEIEKEVESLNAEANRFLLSNTQHKLHELMADSDTPFVFEKIGSYLRNIMIDEFQDTSTVQWDNFKKLLCNIMAERGSQNLIVGDVKQSIYRWRNGDWSLLQNIQNDKEIAKTGMEKLPLSDNWRSEERIINFNNAFFDNVVNKAVEVLDGEGTPDAGIIRQIYEYGMLKQQVPEKKRNAKDYATNGSVEVHLLNSKSYDDDAMQMTCDYIQTLAEAGVADEQIAIITRSNSDIAKYAGMLQERMPEHTFVSDEAFKLNASQAVNIMVGAMRCLNHPNDSLCRAQLARLYQEQILGTDITTVDMNSLESIDRLLPPLYCQEREKLLSMPLTDLAERLFELFGLVKLSNEAAYVYGFYDQLNSFSQNNVPDLEMFIKQWDETIWEKSVHVGKVKGIRLVTIHKSKGLEFDHVIIPNCSWELEKGSNCLWCSTDEKPFDTIPVLPVDSKKIRGTIYDSEYHREHLENIIDNINMMYVAFTRAKKNLLIIGKNNRTDKNGLSYKYASAYVLDTLPEMILPATEDHHSTPDASLSGDCKKKEDITYKYGELYAPKKKEKTKQTENVFLKEPENLLVEMRTEQQRLDFRQSNDSRNFVDADTDEKQKQLHYINQGTILHNIMSRIENVDKLDEVLEDYLGQGIISNSDPEINRETIAGIIRRSIEQNKRPEIREWFSPDVKVMNEQSIVFMKDGVVCQRRPDRVIFHNGEVTVIDFKFGQHNDNYIKQVRFYMKLLSEMGYKNIRGYLWYVYSNDVVETL